MSEFVRDNPTVVIALGLAVLILFVIVAIARRYKVAGPNEAFIITGRNAQTTTDPVTGQAITDLSGQRVIIGGSVFVLPLVQKLWVLDLSSRAISVRSSAITQAGIKVDLEGVAVIKVGGTEAGVRAAAQRFLHQQSEINSFTTEVMSGSLRAIVGRLHVKDIIQDRAAFQTEVAEEAETSLTNQGLIIDTFQLQDISVDGDYLVNLGRPEEVRIEKEAAVASAEARREAEVARIAAEESIVARERDLELQKAGIKAETDAAQAEADASGPLRKAAKDQEVIEAQEQVATRNAELRDRELDTEIRKPADAERYRVEQDAEARKSAAILGADATKASRIAEAEAAAEATRLSGDAERSKRQALAEANRIELEAQGAGEQTRREALAAAVRAEGDADASAILAKGEAEAEALDKQAGAYAGFGEAAVLSLIVDTLPALVEAGSAPIGKIYELRVISTDGASALTRNAANNVTEWLAVAEGILGVDLRSMISDAAAQRATGTNGDGDGADDGEPPIMPE